MVSRNKVYMLEAAQWGARTIATEIGMSSRTEDGSEGEHMRCRQHDTMRCGVADPFSKRERCRARQQRNGQTRCKGRLEDKACDSDGSQESRSGTGDQAFATRGCVSAGAAALGGRGRGCRGGCQGGGAGSLGGTDGCHLDGRGAAAGSGSGATTDRGGATGAVDLLLDGRVEVAGHAVEREARRESQWGFAIAASLSSLKADEAARAAREEDGQLSCSHKTSRRVIGSWNDACTVTPQWTHGPFRHLLETTVRASRGVNLVRAASLLGADVGGKLLELELDVVASGSEVDVDRAKRVEGGLVTVVVPLNLELLAAVTGGGALCESG